MIGVGCDKAQGKSEKHVVISKKLLKQLKELLTKLGLNHTVICSWKK